MEYSQATRDRKSMIIALALVLALALGINFVDANPVVDTDGQPLKSGVEYRISPSTGGGVSMRMRNHTCPMYVYYAKGGSPVVFTPFSANPLIEESSDLKVEMAASSTCVQSTRWRITTESDSNKRFIYAGDAETSSRDLDYFVIVKSSSEGEDANVYEMEYCPSVCETCRPYCGRVTTFSDGQGTGFLVIEPNPSNHFKLQFKKA